jgi:hypothetical protein
MQGPGDGAEAVVDEDAADFEEDESHAVGSRVADAAELDADAAAAEGCHGFVFPVARVKKIMRIDGDVKKVTIDAVRAVSAALEMFLKQAVEGTGAVTLASGHRQIHDGHFRQFTMNHDEFDFLPDCLPPPSRMPKAVTSKPRVSAGATASATAAAAGGGDARRQRGAVEAAAPVGGGKQTVLTFGRQPAQGRQIDVSSGDEGAHDVVEDGDA